MIDYSRIPDRFMTAGSSDSSYLAVGKADGWAGVRFFYALNVDPGDARVIARLPGPGEGGSASRPASLYFLLFTTERTTPRRRAAAATCSTSAPIVA